MHIYQLHGVLINLDQITHVEPSPAGLGGISHSKLSTITPPRMNMTLGIRMLVFRSSNSARSCAQRPSGGLCSDGTMRRQKASMSRVKDFSLDGDPERALHANPRAMKVYLAGKPDPIVLRENEEADKLISRLQTLSS